MDLVCGTCEHNRKDDLGWYCGNKNSENYGCHTFYDDSCEDWEEKE